jgi:hypothetical protein
MKKFAPETSPIVSTLPVLTIYGMKIPLPENSPMVSKWLIEPKYLMKIYSRDFPYCIHLACPAYIRDENVAPETSATFSTWPVPAIYVVKNVSPEISHIFSTWPVQHIYVMKQVTPETPLLSPHDLSNLYT